VRELTPDEDVERELRAHLAWRTEELVAAGWEPAAARQEAERIFGDYGAVRDACAVVAHRQARTRRRATVMSELLQDVRYALRGIARQPGFALVAVLTLALGMGANSAAFSLVNGVLLRPLPYPEPERLVQLWELTARGAENAVTYPNFQDWQEQSRSFRALAAYAAYPATVLGGAEPVRVPIARVSGAFFDVMGVGPRLGRTFVLEELRPGGAAAVLVSDAYWRTQLGAARDLSGLQVRVAGYAASVIGVMPPGFDYPGEAQLWLPVELEPAAAMGTRTAHNFRVIGRLATDPAAAAAELAGIARSIRQIHPEATAERVAVVPLREQLVGDARRSIVLLFGASGLVLLIACTNIASTLLARSTTRRREVAVRAALGAPRGRIVRQLLTENLVLALFGAALGLLVAWGSIRMVGTLGVDAVPRAASVRLDGWVVAFTLLVAMGATLLFGSAPALRAASPSPYEAIRAGERGTGSARGGRVWGWLIAAEVAFALILLVGAGLLIRSFWNVVSTDPGFRTEGALLAAFDLPESRFPAGADRIRYYDELRRDLAALPELTRFGLVSSLPLVGFDPSGLFDIEGGEIGEGSAGYRVISPGYIDALGARILEGRDIAATDRPGSPPVVLVNRTMADRFFDGSPIGRRIRTGGMDAHGEEFVTIVGVVSDVRHRSLIEPPRPEYYLPYAQRADRIGAMTLVARTAGHPAAAFAPVRQLVRRLDADVPVELHTWSDRVGEAVADRRFTMLVLGAFAAIALVLSGVGIYGVVSYAVARRTREIGIRTALGARAVTVVWTVLRGTMVAVLAGALLGVIGALLLGSTLQALLWEVPAGDPLTIAAVVAVLIAIAAAAVIVPARRALRIDPLLAIRAE
jgi:predicted permease